MSERGCEVSLTSACMAVPCVTYCVVYMKTSIFDIIDAVCGGGEAYCLWSYAGVGAQIFSLFSVWHQDWDADRSCTSIHACLWHYLS